MKKFNPYNGATAASILLAVLVVAKELLPPVKELLTTVFTHHWIAKAVLLPIAFVAFGFYKKDRCFNKKSEDVAWYSVLASLAIILVFYVIHFFV